jgi:cystathionine beta-lyase/cystathionine gamma-synthase
VYGGTYRYLQKVRLPGGNVDSTFVDLTSGMDALWEALSERTRLVWFESPTNPLLKTVDIGEVARTVDRRAAEGGRRPLVVVDNTFASPAIQRPLALGADIVFHSATKYLAGHSDVVLGVAVTSNDEVAERLRFLQNAMGGVPGPLDCFLVLRGLRTLHIRVERHQANARAVVEFLRSRDDVAEVRYPGFGGMVSFLPAAAGRTSGAARAIAIAESTKLFTLAESLGGVESLIEVPAAMTHMSVSETALAVDPALIRLSVGIEGIDDLIADLRQALDRAS